MPTDGQKTYNQKTYAYDLCVMPREGQKTCNQKTYAYDLCVICQQKVKRPVTKKHMLMIYVLYANRWSKDL